MASSVPPPSQEPTSLIMESSPSPPPPPPKPTHFLCIPLGDPRETASGAGHYCGDPLLERTMDELTSYVANAQKIVLSSAIRRPHTLKLTLGLMSLTSAEEEAAALELLDSIDYGQISRSLPRNHGGNWPMTRLSGLRSPGGKRWTRVLYTTPCERSSDLRGFVDGVRTRFRQAGFLLPGQEGEGASELRVTLVNTAYAAGPRVRSFVFDSASVLRRYGDYMFSDMVYVKNVAICRLEEGRGTSTDGWDPVRVKGWDRAGHAAGGAPRGGGGGGGGGIAVRRVCIVAVVIGSFFVIFKVCS